MKDFQQLQVWQRAHEVALVIYNLTATFPKDELFGLTAQLRRAAVSIASNIAEGCGRDGDSELARFCQIAMGSASEVEYQLILARDLGYILPVPFDSAKAKLVKTKKMLNAFIQKLKTSKSHASPIAKR